MSKHLLGVDFGTTSLKACLFDVNGKRLATESAKYTLITKGDFIEFPADEFFNVFLGVYNKIAKDYKIDALSIDTQGETLIVLDKFGKPLMNAIIWLDNRADKEAEEFVNHFGLENLYNLTGEAEVPAGYPAPKIMWIKKNMPEVFEKADKFLLLEDYIIYRLTGKCSASRSLYSSSMLMNIHTGEYIPEILDYLGITENNLSSLYESGTPVGEFNGAVVTTSALDQIAGICGAGIVKEGLMSETTGTALAVCAVTEKFPRFYEGLKVSAYYVRKGLYCLLMWAPTAGATLEWFKNKFCEDLDYVKIDELIESVPSGAEGLITIPHLCGTAMPENNPLVKGGFFGVELKHTRAHFLRSIVESISYMIKEYVDFMNIPLDEIRSMGGGAKSKIWCEIKSSVTGKKVVTLKENETACLGSAIFAGIGIGAFKDTIEATSKIVETNKTYSAKMTEYKELYKSYKEKEKAVISAIYSK